MTLAHVEAHVLAVVRVRIVTAEDVASSFVEFRRVSSSFVEFRQVSSSFVEFRRVSCHVRFLWFL